MEFTYKLPTDITFGPGSIKAIPEKAKEVGANHAFVVTDKGVKAAGILDKILKLLDEAQIKATVFDRLEKEPTVLSIGDATKELAKSGAQVVIGVGGGTSMDTAKAAAFLVTNGGCILDYVGVEKVKKPGLPVIAVPTTAGTGSELTRFIVFTGVDVRTKLTVGSYLTMAKYAILDPELTLTLPPKVTAGTGMDALTHAIESYVNTTAHHISEPLAMRAIELVAKSLRKAVAKGTNLQAREDMLAASALAALAFNSTRLGIVHAMSQPAGGHFDIPHGISNAIMLPPVMEYNLMGNIEKYIDIAVAFGEDIEFLTPMEAAAKSVKAIRDLMEDIGITERLGDFGVKESDLDMLADEALTSGNVPLNPRFPSKADIIEIYKKAL